MKAKDPKLFETINRFLTEYVPVIKRRDGDTVTAYKASLNTFLNYVCETNNCRLIDITANEFKSKNILDYTRKMAEDGYAVKTINLRLSSIKGFCKYAMKNNILQIDQLNDILEISGLKETEASELIYLSLSEITELLKLPDTNTKYGARDRFYIILLYDSGARNFEILNLLTEKFKINKNGTGEINFFGKGNKPRTTPISKEVVDAYHHYCKFWGKKEYLFYTIRNEICAPMSADNAGRILMKYEAIMKKAHPNITHLHPHLFRHSRAMHLLEAGVPLPIIQEWLGHANIGTTRIYASATTEMKRKESEKVIKANPNLFPEVKFDYEDDEDILRQLAGLK
jgi:site-specific recombinase XerD